MKHLSKNFIVSIIFLLLIVGVCVYVYKDEEVKVFMEWAGIMLGTGVSGLFGISY